MSIERPTDGNRLRGRHDLPGTVIAVLFILMAAVALWDTTTMTDPDSYVFPRAIAFAMIVFCILLIVTNLLRAVPESNAARDDVRASTPRRIGLVVAMLISTGAMPWIGFLPSGLGAFGAIMIFAMYDPWTTGRRIVFPIAALAVVLGFYLLFSEVLLVPLPVGSVFT